MKCEVLGQKAALLAEDFLDGSVGRVGQPLQGAVEVGERSRVEFGTKHGGQGSEELIL